MREIKFRIRNAVNGGVDYVGLEYLLTNDQSSITTKSVRGDFQISQYIGLKDKNSIDVYDGDVIKGRADLGGKLKRFIGVVNASLPSVYVQGVKQYSWKRCNSIFDVSCFEVIGNIYENPELLEKSC